MQEHFIWNPIYDCHVHLPMFSSNPVEQLLKELDESRVNGFILVLNSLQEEELYLHNIQLFQGKNHKIALILDPSSSDYLNCFKELERRGIEYVVKIHPRITNITKRDFLLLKERLHTLCFRTVLVDHWIFGPHIENHIGTELSIHLAKELPDKWIVIAHSGGFKLIETMLLTRTIKNIFYDLSLTQLYFKGSSIEKDVDYFIKWSHKRILFGSDYPDFKITEAWNAFQMHFCNAGLAGEWEYSAELAKKIYGLK